MEDHQNHTTFQYTYSAKEQEELRNIRSKYLPREENKMEQLRRLDARVTQKANMYAIVVGIAGALILGVGMCCCMVWSDSVFALGVVIGIAGIIAAALAFPVYKHTLKKERERIAPQMIRLTDDLMK